MKKNLKVLLFIIGSAMFVACGVTPADNEQNISKTETVSETIKIDVKKLIGSWKDTSVAGLDMLLVEDGTAKSLNSETLKYSKWKLEGNKLILSAQSTGNGITFFSDDVYVIEQLNDSLLVLRSGNLVMKFTKSGKC